MSSDDEVNARAGKLIERLLVDPEFRGQFRRDPSNACLAAGLPELAAAFEGSGKSMQTLELRESRSSLAGVVMAIAVEGMGVVEAKALMEHGLPSNVHGARSLLHGHKLANPIRQAERAASPARLQHELGHAVGTSPARLQHELRHAGGAHGAAAPGAAAAGGLGGAAAAGAGAGGSSALAGGAGGTAAAGAGAAGAGAASGAGSGAGAAGAGAAGVGGGPAGAGDAGTGGVVHGSTAPAGAGASAAAAGPGADAAGSAQAQGAGGSLPWPDETPGSGASQSPAAAGRAGLPSAGIASGGGASGAAAGPAASGAGASGAGSAAAPAGSAPGGVGVAPGGSAAPVAPVPAPANPGAQPIDGGAVPLWPDQQPAAGAAVGAAGAAGGGGGAGGGLLALLDSPRLSAPPNVRTFLAAGGVDPRMVSVLDSALTNHTIGLGQIEAVSDPVHVQAVDIVSVDGQPVAPNNFSARDLVTEIAALDPSVRPSEIGTPWPIRSPGFFSDAGVVNRLHLAFEMPGTDSPPAGAGSPAAMSPAAPVAGQVVYPASAGAASNPPPVGGQIASQAPAGGQLPAGNLAPAVSAGVPLSSIVPAPVAASTPGSGVDAALAYARAMIGKLPESAGNNLGPQLDRFEADFGFHGVAWCGIFAGHVLEAAGLHVPPSVASVASILDLARNGDPPFLKGVLPVGEVRPGDLVTFGGTEHVAFVTNVDSAGIHTIAGNTSQSNVSETTYSPGSVTGVVRPDYAAGTPGSIPGVWNYAGVAPPGAGAPVAAGVSGVPAAGVVPGAPAAAGVSEAPAASVVPSVPPAAGVPGAPAAGAVPGAPPAAGVSGPPAGGPVPGVPAGAAAGGAVPGPAQPGTPEFAAAQNPGRSPHRHTVQFLQAVPAPGSPPPGQGAGAAAQIPGAGGPANQPPVAPQPIASAPPGNPAVGGAPIGGAPVTPIRPAAPAVADQVAAPGVGAAAVGGAITVSSSLLTPGQEQFAARLAELTGLEPRVIAAWELAEESGGAAQGREAASNFNWLNIGYFDSGAGRIAFDSAFGDPVHAAEQTAKFLNGQWGGASPSIRAILGTVGQSADQQMAAIANSDWASSHYGGGANLHSTFDELGNMQIERASAG